MTNMTKPAFILCLKTRERRGRHFMTAGIAFLGLSLIAAAVADSFRDGSFFQGSMSKLASGLLLVGVIGAVLLIIVGAAANTGIPCAKCGRRLFQFSASIAVATGNCGYCGQKAFDETEAVKEA